MSDPVEVVEAALALVPGACDCRDCANTVVEALRSAGHITSL